MYVYSCRSMCICVQKKSDLLELELQAPKSHLKWALGTEPRSFGRSTQALNH